MQRHATEHRHLNERPSATVLAKPHQWLNRRQMTFREMSR